MGGSFDAYFAQLSPQGEFRWSASLGGPGNDRTRSVTFDSLGNVCVAGYFEYSAAVTGEASGASLTSEGSLDGVLWGLSPEGQTRWLQRLAGPGTDEATDVACSPGGEPAVTGVVTGTLLGANFPAAPDLDSYPAGDE